MKLAKITTLILIILTALKAASADSLCPESVETHQSAVNPPKNFLVTTRFNLGWRSPLSSVGIFDGPIDKKVELIPDKKISDAPISDKSGNAYAIWKLGAYKNTEQGIWLGCSYGATTIMLSRRLSVDTHECRVTYKRTVTVYGSPKIVDIDCK